jgi:hypothetical protein
MILDLDQYFKQHSEIPYTAWEIEQNGRRHVIDTTLVIQAILESHSLERRIITNTIISIEIRNGDILDYLEFLAKRMIF